MAELAGAALLPAAGGAALTPDPPAPQGGDGGALDGPEGLGAQARTVNDLGRGSGGLVP